jgi:UDP:flavonoid glycosyltransferase YjiC (YdhE family)
MRVIFTFSGGQGHLDPLVAIARAAAAAGHTVAFAGRPWMVPKVEALGFVCFPGGTDEGLEPVTRPLVPIDMEREGRDLIVGFGQLVARSRAPDLLSTFVRWRPDVVVWEETDPAAAIVAERLGLPHAAVPVLAFGMMGAPFAKGYDPVREEYGLEPDPSGEMMSRYLVLSPFPETLRDPRNPVPLTSHGIRIVAVDRAARAVGSTPDWAAIVEGGPSIYFTLGTVFNHESGDLFARVLAGLRELPTNLLVTVGREIDPATLGPQPANVRIERFVPQAEILPHVDLVVSHGGSGSVLGALAHGRPMVVLPIGADQPLNAARITAIGVGRSLDAIGATPDDVREAASLVLADATYRESAGRLAHEIAALSSPDVAVGLLERLARERRPMVAA